MITSLSFASMIFAMLLITFGATMLFATRDRRADSKWLIYGLAVPALGCGGCLIIFPLFSLAGTVAIGLGVAEFCKTQSVC